MEVMKKAVKSVLSTLPKDMLIAIDEKRNDSEVEGKEDLKYVEESDIRDF